MRIKAVRIKDQAVFEITSYDLPGLLGWPYDLADSVQLTKLLKELENGQVLNAKAQKNSYFGKKNAQYALSWLLEDKTPELVNTPTDVETPKKYIELTRYSKQYRQTIRYVVCERELLRFMGLGTGFDYVYDRVMKELANYGVSEICTLDNGLTYKVVRLC